MTVPITLYATPPAALLSLPPYYLLYPCPYRYSYPYRYAYPYRDPYPSSSPACLLFLGHETLIRSIIRSLSLALLGWSMQSSLLSSVYVVIPDLALKMPAGLIRGFVRFLAKANAYAPKPPSPQA